MHAKTRAVVTSWRTVSLNIQIQLILIKIATTPRKRKRERERERENEQENERDSIITHSSPSSTISRSTLARSPQVASDASDVLQPHSLAAEM